MSNLAEALRNKTLSAREEDKLERARQAKAEKTRDKTEQRRLRAAVASFLAERLEPTIQELTQTVQSKASSGKESAERIWRVRNGENDTKPTEELAKYRQLRDKVAEYFVSEGLRAEPFDQRDGYEDTRYPSDEGYRPYIYTDYLIGLELSW